MRNKRETAREQTGVPVAGNRLTRRGRRPIQTERRIKGTNFHHVVARKTRAPRNGSIRTTPDHAAEKPVDDIVGVGLVRTRNFGFRVFVVVHAHPSDDIDPGGAGTVLFEKDAVGSNVVSNPVAVDVKVVRNLSLVPRGIGNRTRGPRMANLAWAPDRSTERTLGAKAGRKGAGTRTALINKRVQVVSAVHQLAERERIDDPKLDKVTGGLDPTASET